MRRRSFLKGATLATAALAVPSYAASKSTASLANPPSELVLNDTEPAFGSKAYLIHKLKTEAGCEGAWVIEREMFTAEVHTIGGREEDIIRVLGENKPMGMLLQGTHEGVWQPIHGISYRIQYIPHVLDTSWRTV